MNKESFLDTIRQQFAEEIREAYIECEHQHGEKVDYPELNKRLKKLAKAAKAQGLNGTEFDELIKTNLPDVAQKLDLGRKAA